MIAAGERAPQNGMRARIAFAALCAVSLVLTTTVNRWSGILLHRFDPAADRLATAAVPSFVLILAAYLALTDRRSLRGPALPRAGDPAWLWGSRWLLWWYFAAGAATAAMGHWIVYARGPAPVAAFLLFGALGEELLFRGIVYERAEAFRPGLGIGISTATFALHHAELHGGLSLLAIGHVCLALPLGWVLAEIRRSTGSLWPAYGVHLVSNLPFAAIA